jgi:hypothetical protein
MNFNRAIFTLFLTILLLLTFESKASLITENWSFIVDDIEGDYLTVTHQSVVNVIVEYESNNLIGHEYNDDGSITSKCALTEAFKGSCNENWLEWSLMADAKIIGYKGLFDNHQMLLDGGNWFDSMPFISNLRFRSVNDIYGKDYVTAQSDQGDFSLNKRAELDPNFSQAHARFEYIDNNGIHQVSSVTGSIFNLKVIDVPEPSSFVILALGMFGFLLRKFISSLFSK